MNEDAKAGLRALLLMGSLIVGITVGGAVGGGEGAWTGLVIAAALWVGAAIAALQTALRAGLRNRKPRASSQERHEEVTHLLAVIAEALDAEKASA